MKLATFIPLTDFEGVAVDLRGNRALVEVNGLKANFYGKGPLKEYSQREVLNFLSNAGEKMDELEGLIEAVDSMLMNRFFNSLLEDDEEAKDELRKVFRVLDVLKEKAEAVHTLINTSGNSLLKARCD
ncbi:hypothetical protein [Caminibacter pacificus]|jgi:hypothetical protein